MKISIVQEFDLFDFFLDNDNRPQAICEHWLSEEVNRSIVGYTIISDSGLDRWIVDGGDEQYPKRRPKDMADLKEIFPIGLVRQLEDVNKWCGEGKPK